MALIEIPTSFEERQKIIKAIVQINALNHIKHMSRAMLSKLTDMSDTKVRMCLIDLEKEAAIEAYNVSSSNVARYYFVITEAGKKTYLS